MVILIVGAWWLLLLAGVLITIWAVGKPRHPITTGDATVALITAIIEALALAYLARKAGWS